MDVTLILTHRCNLECDYCYAGAHDGRRMDPATMTRALDLLFADGADAAQLSFFGGEPFLAFDAMRQAVEGGQACSRLAKGRLTLQVTTNGTALGPDQLAFIRQTGMHVAVSIDGVREAHEMHRGLAGGRSSFDQTVRGLRAMFAAGLHPDALMVITPETAPLVFRSVRWLWEEGVRTVRANLLVSARWGAEDRAELREELKAVGWELLARRLRGESVSFEPFEAGFPKEASIKPRGRRLQMAVGTTGNLYPCAPMVGEDRDSGPEAALRVGHLDDGPAAIRERLTRDGVRCSEGGGCACAAALETGDPRRGGPSGLWYARVCEELGAAIAMALREARRNQEAPIRADEPRRFGRRPLLLGLGLAAGGLALGASVLSSALFVQGEMQSGVLPLPGKSGPKAEPPPAYMGQMEAPPPPPPPPAPVDMRLPGEMSAPPPDVVVDGDMATPPTPPAAPPAQPPEDRPVEVMGRIRPSYLRGE